MNRTIINAAMCGATLGKKILVVERNHADLHYSDAVKNNSLRLSRPIYLYSIKPIDVEKVALVTTANNEIKVEFNDDPKYRLDVANVDDINKIIPKPTAESVRKAVEKYEHSGKEDVTIFTDYVELVKQVTALNIEERKTLEIFLNNQMKICGMLSEANENEKTACKIAMKDLGVDVNI